MDKTSTSKQFKNPRQAIARALAEAAHRRAQTEAADIRPPESGGQIGPEPTRYGDWEKNGIISDF